MELRMLPQVLGLLGRVPGVEAQCHCPHLWVEEDPIPLFSIE